MENQTKYVELDLISYYRITWHRSVVQWDAVVAHSFYRATLCVSADFAVARYPSVCPSICGIRLDDALYADGWRYRQTFLSAR